MEKLDLKKFEPLSKSEMNKIEGGKWGWIAQYSTCSAGGSVTHYHHYNIWGNYDGRYMNERD